MKLKSIMATMVLGIALLSASPAFAYTVKSGDTLYKISQAQGTTVDALKKANSLTSDTIRVGQNLAIPSTSSTTVSASDKLLMAKLVHAEANGEPYAGKVAVATVVFNRVASPDFPNTIHNVIYETYSNGKIYAFTPIQNGTINNTPDASDKQAVEDAIAFRGKGNGSLFYYNPKTSTSEWILSRKVTVVIGHHTFAK